MPLSNQPAYDVTPVLVRQASRDGWVRYAGNAYAVPLEYAAQPLLLKLTEQDQVVVTTPQGALVARYALASAPGVQIGQPTRRDTAPVRLPSAVAQQGAAAPMVEVRSLHDYDLLLGDV